MEVEEIDNHALDGIDHGITMEVVSRQCQAPFDIVEVECTDLLLFWGKVYDWIVKQCQRPFHAIIAVRCRDLDKLWRNINNICPEVFAFADAHHQFATTKNKALASFQPIYIIVICELTEALMAIGMTQIAGNVTFADACQCICHYDVSTFVHATKLLLFIENSYQSERERAKILSILNDFKPNSDF